MFLCHLCLCLMRFQFVSQSLIIQDIALHRKKTVSEKKLTYGQFVLVLLHLNPDTVWPKLYVPAKHHLVCDDSYKIMEDILSYFQFQFQILLILFTGSIWN